MESQAASSPQAGAGSAPAAQEKDELRRSLSQRQLTMIAIGGAIGVGLFLGSGLTIQLAGPGVIISYLLGAAIAAVVAFCLAEMAVVHPFSGSFGIYAETYLSRWVGFCVRATYGLVQIIAIGAEVTAVAIYLVSSCSPLDLGLPGLARAGGDQCAPGKQFRRVRILVCGHQGTSNSDFYRGRSCTDLRRWTAVGHRFPKPLPKWRISAAWTKGRVARPNLSDNQLYGCRDHCGHFG